MPTAFHSEENNALRLLSQDSEYAFELIYNWHSERIYKVAYVYLQSSILAEEVVQDVFFKLWFQRKNLSELRSLEAWLYTVCKNLIFNYLKKISHEWTLKENCLPAAENSDRDDTYHCVRVKEIRSLLQSAIDKLPEQQRLVYVMVREQGLSFEAVAGQLSISRSTVKTHMTRALASIRSFLTAAGETLPVLLLSIIFF